MLAPHNQSQKLDRRQFLSKLRSVIGATMTTSLACNSGLTVAMAYAQKRLITRQESELFEQSEMAILRVVCDVVLPRTDTPSAADLDCHGFIRHQLIHCHSQQEQDDCKQVLQKINHVSKKQHGEFISINAIQQHQLLVNLEQKVGFDEQDKNRFQFLKALLVFGYFTTEVGATKVLNYQAIPGGFNGSIPYTEKSKAWGSLSLY